MSDSFKISDIIWLSVNILPRKIMRCSLGSSSGPYWRKRFITLDLRLNIFKSLDTVNTIGCGTSILVGQVIFTLTVEDMMLSFVKEVETELLVEFEYRFNLTYNKCVVFSFFVFVSVFFFFLEKHWI